MNPPVCTDPTSAEPTGAGTPRAEGGRAAAPVLGVTGAVASGKSTVAAMLEDTGYRRIDADALGHRALETASVAEAVGRVFGDAVLRDDGTVDRVALATAVFGDEEALRRLETLVHPVVRRWIDRELEAARDGGAPAVIDCALLFESGLDSLCDSTVYVDTAEEQRLERAQDVRGWDPGEVRRRDANQLPCEEKRARASHVIPNHGELTRLREAVGALLTALGRQDDTGGAIGAVGGETK